MWTFRGIQNGSCSEVTWKLVGFCVKFSWILGPIGKAFGSPKNGYCVTVFGYSRQDGLKGLLEGHLSAFLGHPGVILGSFWDNPWPIWRLWSAQMGPQWLSNRRKIELGIMGPFWDNPEFILGASWAFLLILLWYSKRVWEQRKIEDPQRMRICLDQLKE